MGTKRLLAGRLALIAETLPSGPFLDLFSGISAAGSAMSPSRQVWCNDAQAFSFLLTSALYTSKSDFNAGDLPLTYLENLFSDNSQKLIGWFPELIADEEFVLANDFPDKQILLQDRIRSESRLIRKELMADRSHCLFTVTHAGSYFGLKQAIEIDSLRYAADESLRRGLVNVEQHRWMLIGICRVLSVCSNSTGHFAQYLTPKTGNIRRVVAKRRRSVWNDWIQALAELAPRENPSWRERNKVFHGDALDLLSTLANQQLSPGVIYADPPYTDDQYSRYYHVLENLVLYDYPVTSGKGEYRPDRFVSSFSQASQVEASFWNLIGRASSVGSALMLSYPTNGLLTDFHK